MNDKNEKEKSLNERMAGIIAGSILKPLCFDALLTVGLGGVSAALTPPQLLMAASVYYARDIAHEFLPNNRKWLAMPVAFALGAIKGLYNESLNTVPNSCLWTAGNNLAYETSRHFLKDTMLDDWMLPPVIEHIEGFLKTWSSQTLEADKIVKDAFAITAGVALATNLFIFSQPILTSLTKKWLDLDTNNKMKSLCSLSSTVAMTSAVFGAINSNPILTIASSVTMLIINCLENRHIDHDTKKQR